MSLSLEQLKAVNLASAMTREMARIEDERLSWRRALIDTDTIGRQVRQLAEGSAYSQIAKEREALQSPTMSIAKQYQDLLISGSAIGYAYRAWQESERAQMEQMRKLFDPMASLRKSVLEDTATRQFIKELTEGGSIGNQMKEIAEQKLGIRSVAQMLAQQAEDSRSQTKERIENLGGGSSIQSYLKDFEHINKIWKVPNEVLGIVGIFKELQGQLGRVALPTIDWGSAAALAKALGHQGIQEQLALLGIEPDGSMRHHAEKPEKGLFSRKQSDAVA